MSHQVERCDFIGMLLDCAWTAPREATYESEPKL